MACEAGRRTTYDNDHGTKPSVFPNKACARRCWCVGGVFDRRQGECLHTKPDHAICHNMSSDCNGCQVTNGEVAFVKLLRFFHSLLCSNVS